MKLTNHGDHLPVVFGIQYTNLMATDVQQILDAMTHWSSYGFSLIPFSTEITELEDFPTDKIVIPLGGTKAIDLYLAGHTPKNWHFFYDEKGFDQQYYAPIIGDWLLNAESQYVPLREALSHGTFWEDTFVKPTNDLKTFSGVVVTAGNSLQDMLDLMMHKELDPEEQVIIAPWQNLGREFRVISAYGTFAGISQYKNINNVIEHAEVNTETATRVFEAWRELKQVYEPAEVYAVDFVEVDGTLKVVEYNCFNCSGLYKMNRSHVYHHIVSGLCKYPFNHHPFS